MKRETTRWPSGQPGVDEENSPSLHTPPILDRLDAKVPAFTPRKFYEEQQAKLAENDPTKYSIHPTFRNLATENGIKTTNYMSGSTSTSPAPRLTSGTNSRGSSHPNSPLQLDAGRRTPRSNQDLNGRYGSPNIRAAEPFFPVGMQGTALEEPLEEFLPENAYYEPEYFENGYELDQFEYDMVAGYDDAQQRGLPPHQQQLAINKAYRAAGIPNPQMVPQDFQARPRYPPRDVAARLQVLYITIHA